MVQKESKQRYRSSAVVTAQVIAIYVRVGGNVAETARQTGYSLEKVRKIIKDNPEVAEMLKAEEMKQAKNMTQWLEKRAQKAMKLADTCLDTLDDVDFLKASGARGVAGVLNVIIDKWSEKKDLQGEEKTKEAFKTLMEAIQPKNKEWEEYEQRKNGTNINVDETENRARRKSMERFKNYDI